MNILIVDDDEITRKFLKIILSKVQDVEIIHEASNYSDCLGKFIYFNYDIIFLDIDLGDNANGIQLGKELKKTNPNIQIIFSTAYREFAVEAFELCATDYLLKPFNETKVILALNKAKKLLLNTNQSIIKVGNNFLNVNDIIFIEKIHKKLQFITKNGSVDTYDTLNNIEKKLPKYFYKAHQSFLVNIKEINQIVSDTPWTYIIKFNNTNRTAIVSRTKYKELSDLISSLLI